MDFIDHIIQKDKELLQYIHSLGSTDWDSFWLFITNPLTWIPLFILLFYLGIRVYSFKKAVIIGFFGVLAGASSFFIVNIIKEAVKRLRPINDTSINESLRILIQHDDYSFVSGHSTVSFTVAFFSFLALKKYYNHAYLVFLFPILFAYSRLYLAAHYTTDIFCGMLLGLSIGLLFYIFLMKFLRLI